MLVVLKIPVVYLCAVVWWAIRAEPLPPAGALTVASDGKPPECGWRRRLRVDPSRPRGRRGGPFVGARRVASATMLERRTVRA